MQKIKHTVRMFLTYVAVVVLASGYPMAAMAETIDSAPPVVATDSVEPTAPEASTEPVRTPEKYTFNEETGHWDSNRWAFNPATGVYERVVVPLVVEEPLPVAPDSTTTQSDMTNNHQDPSATTDINVDTNAVINNTLNSNATTGDAGVKSNTTGGSATTGDAAAIATIMNTINSSVSGNGAEFATFVTDVVGDVHGDIMLYPMLLAAMLQAATNPDESAIAVNNSATINNDINLNATSGDAAVKSNTTAGNATTGSADTVANVMNIINSIIAANQSFVGTVNIYGNLDGDILVAPDFLPQLLANNGGSSSPSSLTVSSDETQSIINNIDLNAASGNALVANNTTAGNATSGAAKTNLVLLNLSGHQIVAQDSLLVFVNVLGQWVGLIVDAPSGASAAALGTGVRSNNITPDLTIDVDSNNKIVNNLNLNSQSGDASVTGNTTAGNATTGDATASANVANVSNSQLGLTGWFGVLFINVFGSWLGSFGVDTERGNAPVAEGGMGGLPSHTPNTPASNQPFQFVAKAVESSARNVPYIGGFIGATDLQQEEYAVAEVVQEDTEVKGAVATATQPPTTGIPASQSSSGSQIDFLSFIAAAFVIGLGAIAARNIVGYLRSRGAIA